ncbi:MAG: AAA family ATPase [Phycisphaerales bacterium]|nr:AAA family ATPase [Phycisphaerales bacterium]
MTKDGGSGGSGDGSAKGGMDAGIVRVIVCDGNAGTSEKLCALLDAMPGVRLVERLVGVTELVASIQRLSADLVLASLDTSADEVLSAVGRAHRDFPSTTFFAITSKVDATIILTAVRSGFNDVVRLPDESARLTDAINQLRHKRAGEGAGGQIVTVLGSSGGVGCTTLAVNLAVELAEKCGQEVALVDLDFMFGHVAMLLDLEIQHSLADLCGEGKTLDEKVVHKAVMKHKSNVHVIPRPREFEETEHLTAERCVPLLSLLRRMYAYVVLDGPARSDPSALSVLTMADWNVLVVQPLVTSARNAKRILQAMGRMNFNLETVQVVCNRAGGGLSHLNIQRLEKSLGHKIVAAIPDDWSSVSASINLGEPLSMNAPKSKARDAIRELVDIIRGGAGATAGAAGGGGLIGRLFGKGRGGEAEG